MFEREIKFIYDFNLNKVNRLGPYFTFEQLTSIDIHPAVLNYISAEIDYLIFEDRQNLLKNSMFDYSGEKISNYFSQISEEVKRSKRFSQEYIAKLILHASSFNINFLARPKWTLQKFVFDEGDHKTTLEIKQILNYVYYYQYLKKILVSYINSKKILSMNSNEFSELFDKVEELGKETYLQSIIANTLKSMADFFNIGELQKNKIPLAAVELFFEEKKLMKHLKKLKEHFKDETNLKYFVHDYQKVLDEVMIEKHEIIEDEEPRQEVIEESIQPVEESESVKEELLEEVKIKVEESSEIVEDKIVDVEDDESDELEELKKELKFTDVKLDIKQEVETVDSSKIVETVEERPKKLRIKINDENKIEPIIENVIDHETSKIESLKDNIKEYHSGLNEEESLDSSILSQEQEYDREDELDMDEDIPDEESMLESIIKSKDKESTVEPDEEKVVYQKDEEQKIDITELLEHKDMTRIIEVIFDYDIEEFASTLDEISNCQLLDDAHVVINQALKNHNIKKDSKEAESFRKIISEYFNRT
jgi:hypothetical protein